MVRHRAAPSSPSSAASTTKRAVLLRAWFAGLITHAGGFYWISKLLARFGHLPDFVAILLYLVMAGYQAVTFAFFGLVVRRIRGSTRLPMTFVAPLVMVAFEMIIPYLFPCNLAISQAWQTHVIQIADLTGPLGVTALLFVVNGALYDAATRRFVPAAVGVAVLAAALPLRPRPDHRPDRTRGLAAAAPKLRVGIVQGNIAFDEKGYQHPELATNQLHGLQDRSTELEKAGAQLVVWSESSYPYLLPRDMTAEPPAHGVRTRTTMGADGVRSLDRRFSVPLLFGAITYAVDAAGRPDLDKDPYNSAIMLDPDGNFTGRFDKMYLVMFSEHIPLVETFHWIRKLLPRMAGNFTPGDGAQVFVLHTADGHDYKLGPLICFEDIIPAFGRRLAALHPSLFVNITNDAWFGDSSEPWEHLALAVFRTVESRTAMVRSVNTGVSTLIDPNGRVTAQTYALDPAVHPHAPDSLIGEVPLVEAGHTIYDQIGDVFGYSDLVLALALWLVWPRLSRRRASTPTPSA